MSFRRPTPNQAQRPTRRRRGLVLSLLVVGAVVVGLTFSLVQKTLAATGGTSVVSLSRSPGPTAAARWATPSPATEATPPAPTPRPSPSPVPQPSTAATHDGGWLGHVRLTGGYRIIADPVPFTAQRRRQTAAYSLRHYGQCTWQLHPQVIVLHWTAGSSYEGAHAVFASDAPDLGELPGDVAHFIIAQNGRIYQQLSTQIRGRHAIGLNWVAIGIEFVQVQGCSSHWADLQILQRIRQIDAGLALVDYLCQRYPIKVKNVIGHAMANDSPFFKDLEGWKNDHTDWQHQDVLRFRRMFGAWERSHP